MLPRAQPLVWTRSDVRSSASLPWALAGLWVFAAAVLTRYTFTSYGLDERHLRFTYLDIPYHLSLVTSLMRGVPPELATVAGQPINYHWFMHAHVAATPAGNRDRGRCAPPAAGAAGDGGTGDRGHGRAGPPADSLPLDGRARRLVLVGVAGLPMLVDFGKLFSPGHVFLSPTTIYAQLLLVGFMGVCLHMLGPSPAGMPRWSGWPAAVVLLLARRAPRERWSP